MNVLFEDKADSVPLDEIDPIPGQLWQCHKEACNIITLHTLISLEKNDIIMVADVSKYNRSSVYGTIAGYNLLLLIDEKIYSEVKLDTNTWFDYFHRIRPNAEETTQ